MMIFWIFYNQRSSDQYNKVQQIEKRRIFVGELVFVLIIKFIQNQTENQLNPKLERNIKTKIAVNLRLGVHKTDEFIDMNRHQTKNHTRENRADENPSIDSFGVFRPHRNQICANSKNIAHHQPNKLKRISYRENIDQARIENYTQNEPRNNRAKRRQRQIKTNSKKLFHAQATNFLELYFRQLRLLIPPKPRPKAFFARWCFRQLFESRVALGAHQIAGHNPFRRATL